MFKMNQDAMLYTRGSKGEWDRYTEIGGSEGLRWDNMLPLLKKVGRRSNTGINLTPCMIGREVDT